MKLYDGRKEGQVFIHTVSYLQVIGVRLTGKCGDMYMLHGESITRRCIEKTYVFLQVAFIRLKCGLLLEKKYYSD
jgi:hypothetical protein